MSSVQLILVEDVEHLGKAGELVSVKHGYARNFLLPQGLGIVYNRYSKIKFEQTKAEIEANAKKKLEEASALFKKLNEQSICIETKSGENGKLFGAVTKDMIASTINDDFNTSVSKEQVLVKEPIRSIGDFIINIKLHPEVTVSISLKVQSI